VDLARRPWETSVARTPEIMGAVLGIVYRVIATHLARHGQEPLKRVFHIDIETCSVCGGAMRIVGLASKNRR
jgi:hypothetical protein